MASYNYRREPQTVDSQCTKCGISMKILKYSGAYPCDKCKTLMNEIINYRMTPFLVRKKYKVVLNRRTCGCDSCEKTIPNSLDYDVTELIKYFYYPILPGYFKPEDVDESGHITNDAKANYYPSHYCDARLTYGRHNNDTSEDTNEYTLISVKIVKNIKTEMFA